MNATTSTTTQDTDGMADGEATEAVAYEKGTWQEALQRSAKLLDRSASARKTASSLLWTGAQTAIAEWLPGSKKDVSGENLYNEVLDILGKPRKGDASKIRSVALAVKEHGLVLSVYPNLSKAYGEAVRLSRTVAQQAAEDDAAEKAIESIDVPKSTTTVDGAALILLGRGVDGAVVALLDALGANNFDAHRAFMRAISTEISARVQAARPKPVAKKAAAPKGAAQVAGTTTKKATAKKATAKKAAATKAKAPAKVATKAKPVPVSASKGDPNKRTLPARADKVAAAPKGQPVSEPVAAGDNAVSTPDVPVARAQKGRPVVVRR